MRYLVLFVSVILFRLLPFRLPNVEPIIALTMPVAKSIGYVGGFLFAALSIAIFDILVGQVGVWTAVTAGVYGLLGLTSAYIFTKVEDSRKNYVIVALVSTLAYDCLTGLTVGPLLWGQSFAIALAGQIPFTLLHLSGSGFFAYFFSPAVKRFLAYETVKKTNIVHTLPRCDIV